MTLSTGDPSQTNVKPILPPQYLSYYVPVMQVDNLRYRQQEALAKPSAAYGKKMPQAPQNAYQNNNMNAGTTNVGNTASREDLDDEKALKEEADKDGVSNFTQVTQNMMRIEYEIKLKYTIESDNKPHNVVIQTKTIPSVYSYSVVPKLDPDAFLMARVTDWEDMNLIAGTARIYFDNSYIGESYINPRNTNDTLLLNLGRDKSIVVTRSKVKDKCKDKTFSDNHLLTRTYDIVVRNNKNIPIRLVVEDQMPVTKETDIKIEYLEDSNARFNTETGKLVWDFNLKPKDTKKLTFSFEIKSPKDKVLNAL